MFIIILIINQYNRSKITSKKKKVKVIKYIILHEINPNLFESK